VTPLPWQEKQTQVLRSEIDLVLAPLTNIASLCDLVKESLTQERRAFATEHENSRPWPLLPLIICEAISGQYEVAIPVAAARQFMVAAADIFDDIEDEDSPRSLPAKYGVAAATNVATTLLILAERAVTRLKDKGVSNENVVRVMDSFNSFYATACVGQHLDLSLTPETAASEEIYLRIIELKSASQVKCACNIGALLAGADRQLIAKFSDFGYNLGMASQITNDIQGITDGKDIFNRKITLPVIYALNQTEGDIRLELETVFCKRSKHEPATSLIQDLLFRTGGIHYAVVKMELYRQKAMDILSDITKLGIVVERLKLFLE